MRLAVLLVVALGYLFGLPWAIAWSMVGPAMRALWRYIHGPERSQRARSWVLGMAAGWGVLLALPLWEVPHAGPPTHVVFFTSLLCLAAALHGLAKALPPVGDHAAPRAPALQQRDHDGLQVTLTHRSALPAILITGSVPLWPLSWPLAAVWALLPRRAVVLRLRPETVEVGAGPSRQVVPLRGLWVLQEDGLDGSPQICLLQGERRLRVGVGGHDPAEVAWVVAEIRAAAHSAPAPAPEAEPPDALRRMLARPQREHA